MQRSLCILLFTALLGGCGNGNPVSANDPAKMELHVYQVPPENTKNLEQALNNSFATGEKTSVGKVSSPNPGQLLVLAPANLQDSIATSLKSLGGLAKPAAATAPEQIGLQYWSVDALAGAGDDSAALASLSSALGEVRKTLGTVHFELRDHISSVSGINEDMRKEWFGAPNEAGGRDSKTLSYRVNSLNDRLTLQLHYSEQIPVSLHPLAYTAAGMSTTVPVQLGQTLVLSQFPIYTQPLDGKSAASAATRLYIVRADRVATN